MDKSDPIRSYHFNVGDSTQGPLGLCARVDATSSLSALAELREVLDNRRELDVISGERRGDIEDSGTVYFDVSCQHCGRSGCLGTSETFSNEDIDW